MTNQYKILVVDDLESNLALARTQLQDHVIETAGDLVAAVRKLKPENTGFYDTGDRECLEEGYGTRPAIPRVRHYDVLLTDLNFPAAEIETFDRGFPFYPHYESGYPSEPLGVMLALYATRFGIPLIGVHTDGNHHSDAFNGMLDLFQVRRTTLGEWGLPSCGRHVFTISESRLMFFDTREVNEGYEGDKRWDLVLQRLQEGN